MFPGLFALRFARSGLVMQVSSQHLDPHHTFVFKVDRKDAWAHKGRGDMRQVPCPEDQHPPPPPPAHRLRGQLGQEMVSAPFANLDIFCMWRCNSLPSISLDTCSSCTAKTCTFACLKSVSLVWIRYTVLDPSSICVIG